MPTETMTAEQYRKGPGRETEAKLQSRIVKAARNLGWASYHAPYAIGADAGYPDLTLVHPTHGVVWLELKTVRGKVSKRQVQWLELLQEAGQQAYLIYPDDEEFALALLRGERLEAKGIRPS